MVSPAHDRAIARLLEELTKQEFCHPETGVESLRLDVEKLADYILRLAVPDADRKVIPLRKAA